MNATRIRHFVRPFAARFITANSNNESQKSEAKSQKLGSHERTDHYCLVRLIEPKLKPEQLIRIAPAVSVVDVTETLTNV